MVNGRATTVGALDTRLTDFREEVTRRFDDLGDRIDNLVHVDTYRADRRTDDGRMGRAEERITDLEERNKRIVSWLAGLGIAIVGTLLGNMGYILVHVH